MNTEPITVEQLKTASNDARLEDTNLIAVALIALVERLDTLNEHLATIASPVERREEFRKRFTVPTGDKPADTFPGSRSFYEDKTGG